ncbi:MAG: TetR family transcriptional regulator [Gordonia amarae]
MAASPRRESDGGRGSGNGTAATPASPCRIGRPIGLREKHKIRTRNAIRDAAMRLFKTQGYAGTTVEQIAREAEVSHTTFFRYFASKEQVVLSDDLDDARTAVVSSIPPGLNHFDFVRTLLRGLYRAAADDPWTSSPERLRLIQTEPALRVAQQLESDRAIYDTIDLMADYLGVDPANPRLRAFAAAIGGMMFHIANELDDVRDDASLNALLEAIDLLEQGLPL